MAAAQWWSGGACPSGLGSAAELGGDQLRQAALIDQDVGHLGLELGGDGIELRLSKDHACRKK